MRELPPQIVERMKTMTPEQQKEVIDYYRRNDEEEVRLKSNRGMMTIPLEEVRPAPSKDIPETIKRPTPDTQYTPPSKDIPETIKNPMLKYVDEVFTDASKVRKGVGYVLEKEAELRDLEKEDLERLTDWANKVAVIESNNIPDRTQDDKENGIGRGKYQFESAAGSGTNKTARNRLKNWEKENGTLDIPKADRKELEKEDPDFSKLSEETQDIIFFIHHSKHELTPLTKIAKGTFDPKDAWIKYHWAGSPKDKAARETKWDSLFDEGNYKAKLANLANTFVNAI